MYDRKYRKFRTFRILCVCENGKTQKRGTQGYTVNKVKIKTGSMLSSFPSISYTVCVRKNKKRRKVYGEYMINTESHTAQCFTMNTINTIYPVCVKILKQ